MSKAISEETKQKIVYLNEQGNLSDAMIAQATGVSERTVRRYRKTIGLDRPRPDSNGKDSPAVDRPSPNCPDQAKESTDGLGRPVPGNRKQWLCKTPGCGFITDKKNVLCPRCRRGPFFSCFIEVGSLGYKRFIEENQKQEETEEPENEEPRDPSKYKDPEPQDNKDSEYQDKEEPENENETNTRAEDEESQEYEYECPKCHKEFNEVLERCPHCGTQLEESWECPKCHHRWFGSSDKCPKCGAELQE